ncbi:MAG: glycosyltransferase [Agathobacter sp.]|nr:glycosyltransferase [Agathobacter sp.]
MSKNNFIPIFYACDENYVKYTMVSIKSMIENANPKNNYKIYILCTDVSNESLEKLSRLQNDFFSIEFVDMEEKMKDLKDSLPVRDYFSMTTYYRMFIPQMFPELDKVVYIDSDTIVLGDIADMYNFDLGDNYVAAAQCQVIVQEEIFSSYVENVLGMDYLEYFNAGVLVMNCKAFREIDLLKTFLELLDMYTFVVAQDQDYLNLICKDKVLWMDSAWNMEVFGELPCKEEEMKIIHYNLSAKPWNYPDCRLAIYFWRYAKMTEVYEEISDVTKSYTQEQRNRDALTEKSLIELALSEINKEDNYYNLIKASNGKSADRLEILKRIEQYEKEGRFTEDVEDDPPGKELKPEDINYLSKSIKQKFKTRYAFRIAHWFVGVLLIKKKMIIKEIKGIENWRKLHSGAIITCNHFNAFDSFAIHLAYDKSHHKRRKFYRVIREGNYTSFPGFYGFLMRNCNTLPLSSNKKTMEKFLRAVDTLLKKGHYILVYPEQSMWWNYRKPKPLQKGAFTFAARNNVPVIPCFITMEDSEYLDDDGFPVQEYTIHVGEPIQPNPLISRAENVAMMRARNYEVWKKIYEETYGVPLEYTTDEEVLRKVIS